jgi:NADH:ubiquinone oxidoreductase subunit 2 (subunit N)
MAFSIFIFILTAGFFIFALFDRFFIVRGAEMEFSILVYLAAFASVYLLFADSFPEIILCLERITFLSYTLVASGYRNRASSYAAVQSIILGSLPTVFLIFSFVLLYQLRGSIKLSEVLSQIIAEQPLSSSSKGI